MFIRATKESFVSPYNTTAALGLLIVMSGPVPTLAQTPPTERPAFSVTASAGLSLTSGNTDTSMINVAYEVVVNPEGRNLIKSDGLLLRGKNEDQLTANRLSVTLRDQFQLNRRAYVFVQNQYLADTFKEIDYFNAPTTGAGYKVIDSPTTRLSLEAGIGVVGEKRTRGEVNPWLCMMGGESFTHALTPTTTITQWFSGILKTKDVRDSLYTLAADISATITARSQLKIEVIDTFRNRTASAAVEKNDVALIVAFVYKM